MQRVGISIFTFVGPVQAILTHHHNNIHNNIDNNNNTVPATHT